MKHAEFKAIARQHQIDFKVNDPEINIAADRFPIRTIRKNGHSRISPWQYNPVIQRLWTL